MGREPLELKHQALLNEKFNRLNLPLSEYNFANLYLFCHVHKCELLTGELNFIKGVTYDGQVYLMPLEEVVEDTARSIPYMKEEKAILFPLLDTSFFPSEDFKVEYRDADSDYIYQTKKLQEMSGRRLSSRRNLIKQFVEEYEPTIKTFTDQKDEALAILEEWASQARDGKDDVLACRRAIELKEKLHLEGIVVYVDGEAAGFCLGNSLNNDHFLFQFSKAKRGLKGVYQYLYQEMAKSINSHYAMIDLEQDLGLPGLRQAKHSYDPDHYNKKWRVSL